MPASTEAIPQEVLLNPQAERGNDSPSASGAQLLSPRRKTWVNDKKALEPQRGGINLPEDVSRIVINSMFLEQRQIFVFVASLSVMRFLILNVANNCVELRMAVRECPVTFLPTKPATNPFLSIDEI